MKTFYLMIGFAFALFFEQAIAQQQSSEKYAAYVGWEKGKFPPTQEGIQAAINALKGKVNKDNGGAVIIAPGKYTLDKPLEVYPYITLSGAAFGWGAFTNTLSSGSSAPTFVFKNDSLSATDSTRNFLFALNDTVTTNNTVFNFVGLGFILDTTGAGKAYGKHGVIYLKNGKTASTSVITYLELTNCNYTTKAAKAPLVYVGKNDSVKTLRTYLNIKNGEYAMDYGLSIGVNEGILYLEEINYLSSPQRDLQLSIKHAGIYGKLYQAKNWEQGNSGVVSLRIYAPHNNFVTTLDSCAPYFIGLTDVLSSEYGHWKVKGIGQSLYVFKNCKFWNFKIDFVKGYSQGGHWSFENCGSRELPWSTGFELNCYVPVEIDIINSRLYYHGTSANRGVINLYAGAEASKINVFNSSLFSRSSNNVSIYSQNATSGANMIYNSILGDTTSVNFSYTGAGNQFISYP